MSYLSIKDLTKININNIFLINEERLIKIKYKLFNLNINIKFVAK